MKMKKMDFDNSNKIDPENGFENKENSNLSAKQKKSDQLANNSSEISMILNRVEKIENLLGNIWNETSDKWLEELKEIKWKYAGIVMDRFFLYLSLIYFVLTFFPIILTMPNFYKFQ